MPDKAGIPDPTCINLLWSPGTSAGIFYQPTSPAPDSIVAKPDTADPVDATEPSDPVDPGEQTEPDCGDDPGTDGETNCAYLICGACFSCPECSDSSCVADAPYYGDTSICEAAYDCCDKWNTYHYDEDLHNAWVAWRLHQEWVAYDAWLNAPTYEAVFVPNQAVIDARNALLAWIGPNGACNLISQVTKGCCITIYMDANVNDWTSVAGANHSITNLAGNTTMPPQGSDSNCTSSCQNVTNIPPDQTSQQFIMVNITDQYIYQKTDFQSGLNTFYGKYNCPNQMFFTSTSSTYGNEIDSAPTGMYDGYHVLSFFQLMEHEMGHWFGLDHPEKAAPGGLPCNNNHNCCGTQMVMSQGQNQFDTIGENLTAEDKLMFQKLYCPSGCDNSGVDEGMGVPDFNPTVHPNPSTGETELDYTLASRELVQVSIYDEMGREVREVYSGFEDPGARTLSLGTEALPSGHYICRVTVGDRAAYVDMVIQK